MVTGWSFTPAGADQAAGQVDEGLPDDAALPEVSVDEWFEKWMGEREFGKPLSVSKFFDRFYYLNRDIWWQPRGAIGGAERTTAPRGFVTDLASIPRIFWSVLAPDDEYAYAAVLHDWLYWDQSITRDKADQILKISMEELGVAEWKVSAIHLAVQKFGESSWTENAKLKAAGEKRVIRIFPSDPTVRWADWKMNAGVFH